MVDTASLFDRVPARQSAADHPSQKQGKAPSAVIIGSSAASIAAYSAFCEEAMFPPPQSPAWFSAWVRNASRDPFLAGISHDGRLILALGLEVANEGMCRVARFIGGSHANGNFPAVVEDSAHLLGANALGALAAEIRKARPDIDLIALERQLGTLEGLPNPLLELNHVISPNIALATDISGGFEALLGRVNGKRKRKRHRSQLRKFEAAGGFERYEATNAAEVDEMLAAFFAMKAHRFSQMGIADPFAPEEVRAAFRTLFSEEAGKKQPSHFLHGLKVGGKLRAVIGSSRSGNRLICDFAGFSEDELTDASPGNFLFYENVKEACEQGYPIYDFGVGDEPYKRTWGSEESMQYDVFIPLTAKGRLLAARYATAAWAKRVVKRNDGLWQLAKTMRRRLKGDSIQSEPAD
ncbi:MAG TPA: GNAT family N-acetyltransferase [Rhizobiaceae bacterium]|nr:GNAT family N-acetyltransferase [Rhizobiaceae bacterium]